MTNTQHTPGPSKGHIAWIDGDRELFEGPGGDIYIAKASDAIDCLTGYRMGRWEGPSWHRTYILEREGVKEGAGA